MTSSTESKQSSLSSGGDDNETKIFMSQLLQMDLDRIKYLLSSYLRIRLQKIDKHLIHILSTAEMVERLSAPELNFAKQYVDLVQSTFDRAFLDHIPESFRSLTEPAMIGGPSVNAHVCMRVREQVGEFDISHRAQGSDAEDILSVSLDEGDIVVGRYVAFRPLLQQGKMEML
eukprot:TRINITY_DN17499_c0_g1_i3.p1 TRINITY_DN17499_c0_g1~~TRINITY_DN17499_c0_g1_i3.p1  ORF type:complete len:173 (+),score=8.14 TRINITY_DN17499_c0_g1_i3:77-595(+)